MTNTYYKGGDDYDDGGDAGGDGGASGDDDNDDDDDDRTLCDGKCARVICRVVSRWSDDEISTSSPPPASRCLLGRSNAFA